jgi:cation diffusion facilitator family transporter
VGLIVTGFAYAPPCEDHHYGHRKYETSASLVIGLGLLLLAYHVVEGAFFQASRARLPEIGALNWIVIGLATAANLGVAWYETRQGQHLGSEFLIADAAHTRADVYVTLGVVASFAGARAGLTWVDPVVATAIAGFVAVLAVQILLGAFHVLTDRATIPREQIEQVVLGVEGVVGCREVRTRGRVDAAYVDLAVHADGKLTLYAAHALSEEIEQILKRTHPQIVDVVVHVEPAKQTPTRPAADAETG